MTTIKAHLSSSELEARYKGAVDPVAKSHFHALRLMSKLNLVCVRCISPELCRFSAVGDARLSTR